MPVQYYPSLSPSLWNTYGSCRLNSYFPSVRLILSQKDLATYISVAFLARQLLLPDAPPLSPPEVTAKD